MTTQQLLNRLRAKLLETTTELLSDETLLIYLNQGKLEVETRLLTDDRLSAPTALAFTGGVAPVPATFATSNFISTQPTPGGTEYKYVRDDQFNKGVYPNMVTRRGSNFYVFPADTSSLYMTYYSFTPDLTTTIDPTLPPYFHELILIGALYRSFEDLQDFDLAKVYRDRLEVETSIRGGAQSNLEERDVDDAQMFDALPRII